MEEPRLSYLEKKVDARGVLSELIRSEGFGQVFFSRTKPGQTRGNHYHILKHERFFVLEGRAIVHTRPLGMNVGAGHWIHVSGENCTVVDIPPGHVHSIENVGDTDLILVVYVDATYDPRNPDTYQQNVLGEI
jgi:UDP-2-acetamido-2,6-beta-L-arabino-hexul-4-ose reductase